MIGRTVKSFIFVASPSAVVIATTAAAAVVVVLVVVVVVVVVVSLSVAKIFSHRKLQDISRTL